MREEGHLLALGCGYSASRLARTLMGRGWHVSGTSRSEEGCKALQEQGMTAWPFDGSTALPEEALAGVSHILVSIPPGAEGDRSLQCHREHLLASQTLEWVGILSTTGVYGDAGGAWIDEDFPPAPLTAANERRLVMENDWLAFGKEASRSVQVFRLPGIYGPHRSPFARLRAGQARCTIKPGQVFNRVHVDDIVAACLSGMERPQAGPVFHIADGVPAASEDVLTYAAELLDLPPPPRIPIEEAGLPPMALHFYAECKRLDISRARRELGFAPLYADYRDGLKAILAEETTKT